MKRRRERVYRRGTKRTMSSNQFSEYRFLFPSSQMPYYYFTKAPNKKIGMILVYAEQ